MVPGKLELLLVLEVQAPWTPRDDFWRGGIKGEGLSHLLCEPGVIAAGMDGVSTEQRL